MIKFYKCFIGIILFLLVPNLVVMAGALKLINNTYYEIYIRHVSVVCPAASRTYETDLKEVSQDKPLNGHGELGHSIDAIWDNCFFGEQYFGNPPAFIIGIRKVGGPWVEQEYHLMADQMKNQAGQEVVFEPFTYDGKSIKVSIMLDTFEEDFSGASEVWAGIKSWFVESKPGEGDKYYYNEEPIITVTEE